MLPSPGKRLLGILSPGLVPSMDYSISLRALDHTELYLDSQNESSNLQEGVRGCTPLPHAGPHVTHPRDWLCGSCSVSQQPRSRFEGMAGEGPALSTEAGPKAGQKNLLETVKYCSFSLFVQMLGTRLATGKGRALCSGSSKLGENPETSP